MNFNNTDIKKKLNNLKKDQLASLQKKGYLLPIYMAVASHARMRSLVDKKDKRVG